MVPAVEELGSSPDFYSSDYLCLCTRIFAPILFSNEDLKDDDERSEIGVSCSSARSGASNTPARSNLLPDRPLDYADVPPGR